jgi:cytochrome c biogenesis protein CcmG, thiol:disulfide interchange protein DsbE
MNARVIPRAAFALLALGGLLSSASRANDLRLGAAAPPAVLVTLDGRRIATADLSGQVVILTFWATWCVPCRDELPLLSAYAQAHAAQGLTVLAFSLDTPEDLARVRTIAHNYDFPSGLLSVSSAPGYGRIWHIPVNFTIDRQGVLVDDGWKDKHPVWTAERLERIVTPLLASAHQPGLPLHPGR